MLVKSPCCMKQLMLPGGRSYNNEDNPRNQCLKQHCSNKVKFLSSPWRYVKGGEIYGYASFCGNNSNCFPKVISSDCTPAMFTTQNHVPSRLMSANIKDSHIQNNDFYFLFWMDVELGLTHWGKNVVWGRLRMGCWERYLGLRGTR